LVALALRPPTSCQFTSPARVVAACPDLWLQTHEEVWVVAVDSQLRQIVRLRVSIGSTHRTHLPIKEIVRSLVAASAAGVFVLHNHPGGGLTPSEEDLSFTRELRSLCELVDVQLHDHLIVAGKYWVSCVTLQKGTWFHQKLAETGRHGHWWHEGHEVGT